MSDSDTPFEPQLQSRLLRKGLKLSHLRLFAALADAPQITSAALHLGISQPAASRLAAEAQRITGAILYIRSPSGIALTPAGSALARRARRILLEFDQTDRELAEVSETARGNVYIGTVTGPALEHVLPAVRQARLNVPRVSVNVQVATSNVLGAALVAGRLDFALARLPSGDDARLFRALPVGPEPISLIVRAGHPMLRQLDSPPERLVDFDWVLPLEGGLLRTTIEKRLLELGLPLPRKVINTSSFLFTIAAVRQTNAIAAVSTAVADFFSSFSTGEADQNGIVQLPYDFLGRVEPYSLLTIVDRELTPAAMAMYELVRARAVPGDVERLRGI
jgi:DNA-binding transcriptional LysR family regulator